MAESNARQQYQDARHQLSVLVVGRNSLLMHLESMATLPLTLSSTGGFVARFDEDETQDLLLRIHEQNEAIDAAMACVREAAEQAGMPVVEWIDMPRRGEP